MSTFESEIGFFTVFLIIVLASVYIWTSYNAIELNKNCSSNSVNISKKYKDLEKYLKYDNGYTRVYLSFTHALGLRGS
jgi:hypothetical protein